MFYPKIIKLIIWTINVSSHVFCNSFMAYLFIKYHCTRVETEAPTQVEVETEPESVVDNTFLVNQGRHPSIFLPCFGSIKIFESYLCISLWYKCLLSSYLMHYLPWFRINPFRWVCLCRRPDLIAYSCLVPVEVGRWQGHHHPQVIGCLLNS